MPGSEETEPVRPRRNGEERLLYLMSLLSHPDPRMRRRGAASLGRLQDPGVLDSLLVALHDTDAGVQQQVVRALGARGDPRAIPYLRYLAPHAGPGLRDRIGEAERAIAAMTEDR